MKYLHYPLYARGQSGLSNLVMSCEVGVVAAFLLDRTLVIEGNISPPANRVHYGDADVDGATLARITDLIDLPVSWIDFDQAPYLPHEAQILSRGWMMDCVFVWPPQLDRETSDFRSFARGREEVLAPPRQLDASVVQLFPSSKDGHNLENLGFYSYFYYLDTPTRRAINTLLRLMQPKPEYQALATRVSADLGEFNAVHIRRGDFKVTFGTTTRDRSPSEALRVLDENFDPSDLLVILTDEREDPFFDEITAHYSKAVFVDHLILEDYRGAFDALPFHDSTALAYLSQLIAADSMDFVGTMTSTYTSLVQRYRGNQGRPEAFKFLWNELPDPAYSVTTRGSHPPSDCVRLHPDGSLVEELLGPYSWNRVNSLINPAWQREWPESFLSEPAATDRIGQEARAEAPAVAPDSRESPMAETPEARLVDVKVHLSDGVECRSKLPADSPFLETLFEALTPRGRARRGLLQLPTEGGHTAISFSPSRLVAVETTPPVLVESEAPASVETAPPIELPEEVTTDTQRNFARLPFVQANDFLTPKERHDLFEWLIAREREFSPAGDGPNLSDAAIDPAFAERIAGRMTLLLPQLLPDLDSSRTVSAGDLVLRVQLDGYAVNDSTRQATHPHELTCTYFLYGDPKPHAGGQLKLRKGDNVHMVDPRNNAVVAYPADALEEMVPLRCPTGAFEDSRFAISARIA